MTIVLFTSCFTFAFASDDLLTSEGIPSTTNVEEANGFGDIPVLRTSKHTYVSVLTNSRTGTTYKYSNKVKYVWKINNYSVYMKNIGTGVMRFDYKRAELSWQKYAKWGSSWRYINSGKHTYRKHVNASDIYSFLLSW